MIFLSASASAEYRFKFTKDKSTLCFSEEAIVMFINATRNPDVRTVGELYGTGSCASFPGNTRMEVLARTVYYAKVGLYKDGVLNKNDEFWVPTLSIVKVEENLPPQQPKVSISPEKSKVEVDNDFDLLQKKLDHEDDVKWQNIKNDSSSFLRDCQTEELKWNNSKKIAQQECSKKLITLKECMTKPNASASICFSSEFEGDQTTSGRFKL